jgi:CRP-like cAMP-binding protein
MGLCCDGRCGEDLSRSAKRQRRVLSFLFAGDMFGLAEQGRYLNSAQTITPAVMYRLPVDALTEVLQHDAKLEYKVLAKSRTSFSNRSAARSSSPGAMQRGGWRCSSVAFSSATTCMPGKANESCCR